jgi:electron transfer flavoprotein beta subunit
MKILVCITHVPDTTSKVSFLDSGKTFDKNGVQFIIGPYDDLALARAVELKEQSGGELTVINVGTAESDPTIRKALAIGADKAIRVNGEPTGSVYVSHQIAAIARRDQYDLILMGRESIDYNGGVVHGMVGALLGIPSVSPVTQLDVLDNAVKMSRVIDGGTQTLESDLPLVIGCQEPIAEWKIPNMRGIMQARSKPMEVLEPVQIEKGSSVQFHQVPEQRSECKMIDSDHLEELVQILKNDIKAI